MAKTVFFVTLANEWDALVFTETLTRILHVLLTADRLCNPIQKPIAKDVATAKKLIETYESEYKPKGLIWRVAENFAHEHGALRAAELIANGKGPLGPVLFYELRMTGHVKSGSKYHATEWRTVPDYQGGFLLDGGVHFAAALRVALGDLA